MLTPAPLSSGLFIAVEKLPNSINEPVFVVEHVAFGTRNTELISCATDPNTRGPVPTPLLTWGVDPVFAQLAVVGIPRLAARITAVTTMRCFIFPPGCCPQW